MTGMLLHFPFLQEQLLSLLQELLAVGVAQFFINTRLSEQLAQESQTLADLDQLQTHN